MSLNYGSMVEGGSYFADFKTFKLPDYLDPTLRIKRGDSKEIVSFSTPGGVKRFCLKTVLNFLRCMLQSWGMPKGVFVGR